METVVVTGANRGIGLEFCRQYKSDGFNVIALCRKASEELNELGVEIIEGVDVGQDECVSLIQEAFRGKTVDILVNNAGMMRNETLSSMNFDTIRQQFEVNSLGPLRVSLALLDFMNPGGKIALVTSRMGSISDNTSGSRYGYRMSKAALNMGGASLAQDVRGREVSVAILHPGFVRTDMTGNNGLIDTDESVSGMRRRISELTLANTGSFWHTNGELLPW